MRSHKTRSTRDPSIPGSLQKYGFPRNPRSHSCRFLILYFEVIYILSICVDQQEKGANHICLRERTTNCCLLPCFRSLGLRDLLALKHPRTSTFNNTARCGTITPKAAPEGRRTKQTSKQTQRQRTCPACPAIMQQKISWGWGGESVLLGTTPNYVIDTRTAPHATISCSRAEKK